jgi:hypothetical protein
MTKIIKPLTAYLSNLGICHSIYLDDGRIVASSKQQIQSDLEFVLKL